MLLSSVNFVAKPKCGKAAKSKDEKNAALKSQKLTGDEERLNEASECPHCRLEVRYCTTFCLSVCMPTMSA